MLEQEVYYDLNTKGSIQMVKTTMENWNKILKLKQIPIWIEMRVENENVTFECVWIRIIWNNNIGPNWSFQMEL